MRTHTRLTIWDSVHANCHHHHQNSSCLSVSESVCCRRSKRSPSSSPEAAGKGKKLNDDLRAELQKRLDKELAAGKEESEKNGEALAVTRDLVWEERGPAGSI